jgi:hypothetical protein
MAKYNRRKRQQKIYRYDCTLTGETFKTTREIKNTDDLVSVEAYYEMNPEKDDRPAAVKAQVQADKEAREAMAAMFAPAEDGGDTPSQ